MRRPPTWSKKRTLTVPTSLIGVMVSYPSVATRSFKGCVSGSSPKKLSGIERGGQVWPRIVPGSIVAASHTIDRKMPALGGILTFMAGTKASICGPSIESMSALKSLPSQSEFVMPFAPSKARKIQLTAVPIDSYVSALYQSTCAGKFLVTV